MSTNISPTYLFDVYKKVFFDYFGSQRLKPGLSLKNKDGSMNPAGLMCEIWGKITGKGHWAGENFRYPTPSTGCMVFASIQVPQVVKNAFLNPNKTNCTVANFLNCASLNDPKFVADFLLTVKDNDIKSGPLFRYSISFTREYNGINIGGNIKSIEAISIADARETFSTLYPDAQINSVVYEARIS